MSDMTPVRKWSTYQEQVFAWADNPDKHLLVEACAGSGKTTTIVELYKRLKDKYPNKSTQFLAFNKKIAEELQSRGVPASTMNAFGFKTVLKTHPGIKLETNKLRYLLRGYGVDYKLINMCGRIIDLMKAYLVDFEESDHYLHDRIIQIANDFDLSEKPLADELITGIITVFKQSIGDKFTIDFADQISYPTYWNMSVPKFDFVIIDEAQDMSPNKLELVASAVGERLITVGDPYQAIYGFAGADSESMSKIKDRFNPLVLTLPVTYRCGKKIVACAHENKVAPVGFFAGDTNHEGIVADLSKSLFETTVVAKDFVLCRVSAPLVTGCFNLIKRGIRAQILGKDIGAKLVGLVSKISDSTNVGEWCRAFSVYSSREIGKLRAADKDVAADNLEDQLDCLWVFTEGAVTTAEMINKIERMFDDSINPNSVIFSTIHKSKGLEADNVFILPYKSKPEKSDKAKQEERNLLYVQITRAKQKLYWVT